MASRLPWIDLAGARDDQRPMIARGESGTTYAVIPDTRGGWRACATEGLLTTGDRLRLRGGYISRDMARRAAQEIENAIYVRSTESHAYALAAGED